MSRFGITAQYAGHCDDCDQPIAVGEHITRPAAGLPYVHVQCPDPVGDVERTPCPRCFEIPTVNGKCACYEAGEVDGTWAVGLLIVIAVVLVLVAINANAGSVHV